MHLKIDKAKSTLVGPNDTEVGTKNRGYEDLFSTGFVTVEVRYHDPVHSVMVLERPPTTNVMMATDRRTSYEIPVPWQVYIVDYQSGIVRTYFRKDPLKDMGDELFLCYLDHVKPDGSTCADGYHRGNARGIVASDENPFDICAALINDAVWSGGIHGASYMEWYAGVPAEIKQYKKYNTSTTEVLDQHFDVARVMNEVTLLSYSDDYSHTRYEGNHRWSDWYGESLTLDRAIRLTKEHGSGASLKRYFDNHV